MFDFISEDHPVMAVCEISALKRIGLDTLRHAISALTNGLTDSLRPEIIVQKSPLLKLSTFAPLIEHWKSTNTSGVGTESRKKPMPPQPTAEAIVIESWVSAADGKAILAIVQRGALAVGESFVVDRFIGRIRSIQLSDMRYVDKNPQIASRGARDVKYALPGMPVLVSVTLDAHFKVDADTGLPPSGSPLFQFTKDDAEEIYGYRNLMMGYKTKEISGQLFVPTSVSAPEENVPTELPEHNLSLEDDRTNIYSVSNPQVSPLSSPEVAELLRQSRRDIPSTGRVMCAVIRADNSGMLDAIVSAARVITLKYGVYLRVLRSGVGEVSPTDLWIAQVAIEENGEDKVHFLSLNTTVGAPARQWLDKHKHRPFAKSIDFRTFNVFLDLISSLKEEMKLKFPDIVDPPLEENPTKTKRIKRKRTK
jgi:hypothetical protein